MNWWMIFCLGVTTYTVVFFEASYQGFRNLTGAQIDLLPGLVVYVALAHGSRPVAIFSLVAGLLYDSVSVNPLGISVIPLLLIGMGVCQKRELILKDQRYAQVVLGMAASAIAPLLCWVFLLFVGRQPLVGWSSLWQWLVVTLVGGILTPVWFKVFGRLQVALNHPSMVESSAFRSDRQIQRGKH